MPVITPVFLFAVIIIFHEQLRFRVFCLYCWFKDITKPAVMERRNFLNTLVAAGAGIGLGACSSADTVSSGKGKFLQTGSLSVDNNKITFYLQEINEPVKIIQVADTHLWLDDERGHPYSRYSARMARAYNRTRHFSTGEPTSPREAFDEVLAMAAGKEADILALTGDIFSFPSEAAIEWAKQKLGESGLSYLYVSGNHDWHYEGMDGGINELRETWINERLIGLYHGNDPMMAAYNVKDLTILAIDNSTYGIMPRQLEFFMDHVSTGNPLILMMHIPMYAPRRSTGYGCGHPAWGAATDRNYELEGRERWPEGGHTQVTMEFHRQVFAAPNLLGVFAGHTHRQTVDNVKGGFQFVTAPNATGGFLEIDILPLDSADVEILK
jgi:predicted MPP superfamily phosphohydrolase